MSRFRDLLGASLMTITSVLGCSSAHPSLDDDAGSESGATDGTETESDGIETDGTETGEASEVCQDFCAVQDMCQPDRWFTYEDCLDTCGTEFEVAAETEACLPVLTEFYACLGGLTCEQFDVIFDDPNNPCWDEVVAWDEVCSEALSCELGGGGDEQGSYCSYQFDCYESGVHRVECSAEAGCTCLVEGIEVGSCDDLYPALCEPFTPDNPDQANMLILDRMNECCGWMLEI